MFCLKLPLPPYHKRKMYHCLQISLTCAKDYVTLHINYGDIQGFLTLRKAVTTHVKKIENNTWARVDMEFLFECLTR